MSLAPTFFIKKSERIFFVKTRQRFALRSENG